MERRFRIFRYIIYSTELLVLFVIQGIPNFIPELFGGKPSLGNSCGFDYIYV